MAHHFVGEFDTAARSLHAIAHADLRTQDISLAAIRRVLAELLVDFPVYRTYPGSDGRDGFDQQAFEKAAHGARQGLQSADRPLLDVIDAWLGGDAPGKFERSDLKDLFLRAITRFQQLTPPLAAKSVEDTAFYRYGRLVSRNEVGADPARFSIGVQDFHAANAARANSFPHSLPPVIASVDDWTRGELKQAVIRQALALRAREAEPFAQGEYLPLAVDGAQSTNVIAFLRRHQHRAAITIATRLPCAHHTCERTVRARKRRGKSVGPLAAG
jgi:maltooligosyltrehalose synthase